MTEQTITQPVDPDQETTPHIVSFWGVDVTEKHMLPDGVQYFLLKKMNEGERVKYEAENSQDLVMTRSGDSKMKIDQSKERNALLNSAVTGWHIFKPTPDGRGMEEVTWSASQFDSWLRHADPKIVDGIIRKIRKMNPWLQQDLSVKQIDEQIGELKDLRVEAERREAGNES